MKKWFVIAIAAIILSGVLFVGGMSYLDWDFNKLDSEVWQVKEFEASQEQNIDSVELSLKNTNLTVVSGDVFKIDYEESKSTTYDIMIENGKLSVEENYKFKLFSMFNFHSATMVVTLPQTTELIVDNVNSNVSIDNVNVEAMEVDVVNGHINLKNVYSNRISLESVNGSIDLETVTSTNLIAETINGDIRSSNANSATMEVETVNGRITVKDTDTHTFRAESRNGKLNMIRLKVVNCDLSTVNGDITASFEMPQNECKITVSTQNGDTNVDNTLSGSHSVTATSRNGDIELTFKQ